MKTIYFKYFEYFKYIYFNWNYGVVILIKERKFFSILINKKIVINVCKTIMLCLSKNFSYF